jgi:hypothetical protein
MRYSARMTLSEMLRGHGVDVDETELAEAMSAGLARLLTAPGATTLPPAEADLLDAAGLGDASGAYAHAAATAAGTYAALVATALTVGEAATRLGITEGRVRHRIAARELYALPSGRRRLPAWQFTERGVLPGLAAVLRASDPAEHPLSVLAFLTTPQPDLELDGRPATPEQWLRAGGDAAPVAELAAARG